MLGTFQSIYKYLSCQLEVCKNHYRKENISVGGSEQCKDALFRLQFRET